ncbi:helix-turn-helix transcriptional regulator [Hyphomicrobium sulfonivorans]
MLKTSTISVRRLELLFTLTEAEAAVCQHMIVGLYAPEIAESRGVRDSTVRSQFKSIYAKMCVNRRADLLRLAITVDPPTGRGDR